MTKRKSKSTKSTVKAAAAKGAVTKSSVPGRIYDHPDGMGAVLLAKPEQLGNAFS
jgi:hypothetical protein